MSRSWHIIICVEIAFPFPLAFTADFCLCGGLFSHYYLNLIDSTSLKKLEKLSLVSAEGLAWVCLLLNRKKRGESVACHNGSERDTLPGL